MYKAVLALCLLITNITAFDLVIKNGTKKPIELKLKKEKSKNAILKEIKSESKEGHISLAPDKEIKFEAIGKDEVIFYRQKSGDKEQELLGIQWTDNYYFPIFISEIMEQDCSSCNPFREYLDHSIAIITIQTKGLKPFYSYYTIRLLPKSFSNEILGLFKDKEIFGYSIEFKLKGLDQDGMIKIGEVIDELENIKSKPPVSPTDISQKRAVARKYIKLINTELKDTYKDNQDAKKLLDDLKLYLLNEVEIASLALLVSDDAKKIDRQLNQLKNGKRYTKETLTVLEHDIDTILDYLKSLKEEKKIRNYLEKRLYHYSINVFRFIIKKMNKKRDEIKDLISGLSVAPGKAGKAG